MVVGLLRFELQIPASTSLKFKRQVVRKVIDRIRARFNVSIAEVADNDLWQVATIGVSAVGNDGAFVNEVLDKVVHSVEESGVDAWVVSHELEILNLGESLDGERTLAEAERAGPRSQEGLSLFVGEELPTLDEIEEAAEAELARQRASEQDEPSHRKK